MKKYLVVGALLLAVQLLNFGCASHYLKGVTPEGVKAYLGPASIQDTEAYKTFLNGSRSEAAKFDYLLERIKAAQDLEYYHEGNRHNWLEAYRAGTWLLRHHYKPGQDARDFVHKEVLLYQTPGKPTAIKFPDGSIHIAYYILLNELDLLDETLQKTSGSKT